MNRIHAYILRKSQSYTVGVEGIDIPVIQAGQDIRSFVGWITCNEGIWHEFLKLSGRQMYGNIPLLRLFSIIIFQTCINFMIVMK